MNTCNGCDVNDADPGSPAGYCIGCEAEAIDVTESERRQVADNLLDAAETLLTVIRDYAQAGDIDLTPTRRNARLVSAIASMRLAYDNVVEEANRG